MYRTGHLVVPALRPHTSLNPVPTCFYLLICCRQLGYLVWFSQEALARLSFHAQVLGLACLQCQQIFGVPRVPHVTVNFQFRCHHCVPCSLCCEPSSRLSSCSLGHRRGPSFVSSASTVHGVWRVGFGLSHNAWLMWHSFARVWPHLLSWDVSLVHLLINTPRSLLPRVPGHPLQGRRPPGFASDLAPDLQSCLTILPAAVMVVYRTCASETAKPFESLTLAGLVPGSPAIW